MLDLSVDEGEGVCKFLGEATAQWRNLALEVRSVRSMLEEVISNWEKYSSTVASLQAWLEDGEQMLNQSEKAKRVSTITHTRNGKQYEECFLSTSKVFVFLCSLLGFLQKPVSLDAAAHGHERRRELPHRDVRRHGLTRSEAAASASEREMEGAVRQSQTRK